MADIQTQMPVKLTDNTNTVAITVGSALKIDGSAATQPVSGTITSSPTGTYTVAGTVNSTPTGTYTVAGTVTNVPSGTQVVSGTVTAVPTGTYTVTSTLMSITGTGTTAAPASGILTVQGITGGTAQNVSGTVTAVPSGTYTVTSTSMTIVPSGTQAVSGTVTAVPSGTYTVTSTSMTIVPSGTQAVSGTVTAIPSGTYTVTSTSMNVVQSTAANLKAQVIGAGTAGTADTGVLTVQGINSATPINVSQISQTGIVVDYQTQAALANNSTATLSYTVTSGKTLYLKGILASSSGAPCKVIIDYGAGPTVAAVGFYSASMPYLAMNFVQPPAIAAATVVNIKIQNNAGAAQDVYCTLMGEER